MKKLLSLLAATGMVVTSGITTVACGTKENLNDPTGAFKLASKNINILENVPITVEVQNFDNLVEEALPTIFEHDLDEVVSVELNRKTKALVFTLIDISKTQVGAELKINIKQAQDVHNQTVTLKVVEANSQAFELQSYDVEYGTNGVNTIKIINFDHLTNAGLRPSKFTFNKTGLATVELDIANKEIVIKTNSSGVSNLKLTVSDLNSTVSKTVSIKIHERMIDLSLDIYKTNILAGNLVDGRIDTNNEIGKTGYKVNQESILDSFNIVNNLNLSLADLKIEDEYIQYLGGVGDIYSITGNNKKTVKNSVSVKINQGIDPESVFTQTNLGDVKLFSSILSDIQSVIDDDKHTGKPAINTILVEKVRSRNPLLGYVLPSMFIESVIQEVSKMLMDSSFDDKTFTLLVPTLRGVFVEKQITFTYKFVNEDRVTFPEGWNGNKIQATFNELTSAVQTTQGRILLQEEVYSHLNQSFKSRVDLNEFKKHTTFKKNGSEVIISILSGSDHLFSFSQHDWGFIISPSWGPQGHPDWKPEQKYLDGAKLGFNIFEVVFQ